MADFRECTRTAGLFDLSFRENIFTWWNKQEGKSIAKKLDRILVNDKLQLIFPLSYSYFGDMEVSDHSPGALVLGSSKRSKKPFKVSHFLLHHKEFLPRVRAHWQNTWINGTTMFVLSKKFKSLKAVIKDINRDHFLILRQE